MASAGNSFRPSALAFRRIKTAALRELSHRQGYGDPQYRPIPHNEPIGRWLCEHQSLSSELPASFDRCESICRRSSDETERRSRRRSRSRLNTPIRTKPRTATASRPAIRDTELLTPEAAPARFWETELITVVVSGATVSHSKPKHDDRREERRPVASANCRPCKQSESGGGYCGAYHQRSLCAIAVHQPTGPAREDNHQQDERECAAPGSVAVYP